MVDRVPGGGTLARDGMTMTPIFIAGKDGFAVAGALVGKAASTVATGVAGVLVVDGFKRWRRTVFSRSNVVTATAWGLRGLRAAETGAESARLSAADVVAEAKERIGEPPRPARAGGSHDHAH